MNFAIKQHKWLKLSEIASLKHTPIQGAQFLIYVTIFVLIPFFFATKGCSNRNLLNLFLLTE